MILCFPIKKIKSLKFVLDKIEKIIYYDIA